MDNYEYLQQISRSNRPEKPAHSIPPRLALILKILVGALLAVILLIGVTSLIGNNSAKPTNYAKQLYARMNNVNNLISEYGKNLKSSQMRAINYSLSATINGASAQLSTYLTEIDPDSKNAVVPPEDLLAAEANLYNNTATQLSDAKLNGTLDRIYAAQIQMQVSLLISLTTETISQNIDNPALTDILSPFLSNLNVIDQSLNNIVSS